MAAEQDHRLRIVTGEDSFVSSVEREAQPKPVRDLPPAPPKPPKPPTNDRGKGPQPGDFGRRVDLPASVLKFDDYQRPVSEAWVERKAKAFRWRLIMSLTVNLRPNGDYYVIDGQQRVALLKRTGNAEWPVPIYLFDGLSPQEEGQLFLDIQSRGSRRGLSALDIFWGEHFAQAPRALGINRAVLAAGGFIPRRRSELEGALQPVKQLENAYDLLGEQSLRRYLTLHRHTWGFRGLATSGLHIMGMAHLWLHYGAQIDHASFVQKLGNDPKATPEELLLEALKRATSASFEGKAYGMAHALVLRYNTGRTTHRLPLEPLLLAADRRARKGAGSERRWRQYRAGTSDTPEVAE